MARGIGALRRSQMVSSFGPGATIDLPDYSVIIGGLDWWPEAKLQRVIEPRLEEVAARALGVARLELRAPPVDDDTPGSFPLGVTVAQFPLWFVAEHVVPKGTGRSRPLVHRNGLVDGKYEVTRGKKVPVTPVRFVQACLNGHIADIAWYEFAHTGKTTCHQQLWLDEYGTSGDLTDVMVRCECGADRALVQATSMSALGACKGQRPWLPSGEKCGGGGTIQMVRLLIRTASNAYYPQKLSALSLPDSADRIRAAIQSVWPTVKDVTDVAQLQTLRSFVVVVKTALESFADEMVLKYIEAIRVGATPARRPIKVEEFEALTGAGESLGEDRPEGVFYAKRLKLPAERLAVLSAVERVVLVHRLREVTAQIGFTRFEPVVPDLQGELDLAVRRAPLATEVSWVPAMETWGEGIFVQFSNDALSKWRQRPEVQQRELAFRQAPGAGQSLPVGFDVRYVLLHTIAHLLITAVSLDCGYNASSLRERIYVTEAGCGILIYTGTTDAEGTLGGLVATGNRIERYLTMALDLARLCSNDPVCAQHAPNMLLEERYTLGAACHGCLLIAETSCERRNELLDRSLVVATVEQLGCEFFA